MNADDNGSNLVVLEPLDGTHAAGAAGDAIGGPTMTAEHIEPGRWYWVKATRGHWDDEAQAHRNEPFEWLGCVVHVGSNYLQLEGPCDGRGMHSTRVHFDDFWTQLRHETDAEQVIRARVEHFRAATASLMERVRAITARLGVSTQPAIAAVPDRSGGSLPVLSSQSRLDEYRSALVLAERDELPALFKAMKDANEAMSAWMTASALPFEAAERSMRGALGEVRDRIFDVSLYAGSTDEIVKCRDGDPAPMHEKLHVMQRMLFMDEECLANYRHGGMRYEHIDEFDGWLAQDENLQRVLPFPRCLVAMRVRRKQLDLEWNGSVRSLFIDMRLREDDKTTFLYIRNGWRLYRLSSALEFGETIFPDRSVFDPTRPLMARMFANTVADIISRDDYDEREAGETVRRDRAAAWERENPEAAWREAQPNASPWGYQDANPHRKSDNFRPDAWTPFDRSSVYFDDIAAKFAGEMRQHNRVALVIQGLFDRSEVLHPHPPVSVWSPASFRAAIELVYDGSAVLHAGDAPDFEAYRRRCNATLGPDSVVIGQELYWLEKQAEKECRRRDNDWRDRSEYRPTQFRPRGNPGPGYLARMAQWKPRAGMARFTWHRARQTNGSLYSGRQYGDPVFTSIWVPADRLFNVSAYRPGDYLQFFRDSRTRVHYLKWAPLLLAAEEYHAGRPLDVQEPVPE